MPANLEKSAVAIGLEKSVFNPIKRRAMLKLFQTVVQVCSFHMLVMLRILKAKFQQYMNQEFSDGQAGF